MAVLTYRTLRVREQDSIRFLQIDRPAAGNTISNELIAEMDDALAACEREASVVVLSGLPDVFCAGADFQAVSDAGSAGDPGPLYDLWSRLATGPYVSVCHVHGKANAGGIGFVAACDVALAQTTATFGLSELLFGLHPACVMPFLTRRVGFQKAHYLTLMTQPIDAVEAHRIGLVDAVDSDGSALLRRHLLRLRRLSKRAIARYKDYANGAGHGRFGELRSAALTSNRAIFSDADNLRAIARYVEHGLFPWEESL